MTHVSAPHPRSSFGTLVRSPWIAGIAAYLLIVQAIFFGLPGPASAASAFQQIICAHDAADQSTPHAPLPPQHSQDCCLTGCCAGLGPAALPGPSVADRFARTPIRMARLPAPAALRVLARPEDYPRQARAPPKAV